MRTFSVKANEGWNMNQSFDIKFDDSRHNQTLIDQGIDVYRNNVL